MKVKVKACAIILCSLMFSSASADSLEDAFDSIRTQTVDAGIYKSKTRTSATLGSFSARVDTTSFNLISYTPPRFSAGCGGIDAHFGGFSFVNGIDFQQLVENVSQNALGLVLHLAIEVGCAVCSEKLALIQEWAQKAAEFSVDSCMAAKSLVKWGASALDVCQASSGKAATSGTAADGSEAQKSCATEIGSWTTYQDIYGKETDPTGTNPEESAKKPMPKCDNGNIAWCLLVNMEIVPTKHVTGTPSKSIPMTPADAIAANDGSLIKIAFAEIIMAMMNTAEKNLDKLKDDVAAKTKRVADNKAYASIIYKFAVCGTEAPTDADINSLLSPSCKETWERANAQVISVCDDSDEEEYRTCTTPVNMSISLWADEREFFPNGGLYGRVAEVLTSAATKLATGSSALSEPEKAVISAAPIPLYQLLNLSATYPSIQSDILAPATLLLADMIATQFFEEKLKDITNAAAMRNLSTESITIVKSAVRDFNQPLREASFTEYANSAKSDRRAFSNMLLNNIEMYQRLLVKDIADKQVGANISIKSQSISSFKP